MHGDVFAEIAFHAAFLLDGLADAIDFVFVQIADLLVGLDLAAPRILADRELPIPKM